ncbi:pyridoxamine 5'-phosphate oxidase family protein [Streptomyces sp. CAU 1734]|uniref:pyridoxamine 5'-phosphate oxidase family protein n=1 Tax=Streptomyces sp. CAU 1734 TaxID=3140360 RepID=UPI0032603A65
MKAESAPEIPDPYRAARGLSDEVQRVLRKRGNATIGTVNPNGTPHMAPVWFLFEKSGSAVYFECNSATRKARNIEANGMASVLAKGKRDDGNGLIVLGQGRARLIKGEEAREITARIRRKYMTAQGYEPVSAYLDTIDDAVAELKPEKWVAWSPARINDTIRSLPEYADGSWDKWFLPDE